MTDSKNTRRSFLRKSATLTAGVTAAGLTTVTGLSGCTASEPQSPVEFVPGKPVPWINWAGNEFCYPSQRLAPTNDEEVAQALAQAPGVVRAVGSSHSFSPVVPTDDTLVTTDLLSGLISHDADTHQAEVWAGTRLHDLGLLLDGVGQALPNMPDMDYPSIGGSIANSVHATGSSFGSMSTYVLGMTLATPSGELLECSTQSNADVFQAARASIGSLGIASRIKLQNFPSFQLTEVNGVEKAEDVLDDLDQRFANNRHFEMYFLPYCDWSLTVTTNEAKPGDENVGEDDPHAVNILRQVFGAVSWIPGIGDDIYQRLIEMELKKNATVNTVRTGPSHKVFPHDRIVRFREMEYTVPVEVGPACIREIMQTIRRKKLPVCFPLEYRHVKADDIWLSMFEGRDGAAISVHQFGDIDYKAVFAEIEPIFWKYEGRPHWGKIHTLDASRLKALYPRHWQDFHEVRASLDPSGKMLNDHLKRIFLA